MLITMVIFTGEYVTGNSVTYTLLAISIYMLIYKIKEGRKKSKKEEKEIANKISIGFYLGVTNMIILIIVLLISNYRIL